MKGDAQTITHLNAVLTNELTAVNQYFLHARILKNWGLLYLADKVYKESIEEMKHADLMIERVLFLEGLPNVQDINKILVGEEIVEIFEADLKLETAARATDIEAMAHFESIRDYESRKIVGDILTDTEEHIDWLETQLDLIKRIGAQAYQQQQLRPED